MKGISPLRSILTLLLLITFSISIAQVAVTSGGAGAPSGSGVNGANNAGGNATGLGCGGGGGSWWGGTGGAGYIGGGGGGAGGYFSLGSINWAGGEGGQGAVVIAYYNGASLISAHVLLSGSSATAPANTSSAKVWAIGGGGGGGGATQDDGTSGGSGAAGGVAYITKTIAAGANITYSIGSSGLAGHGTVAGTAGGTTSVTIAGTTIYGYGGNPGAYNNATNPTGGGYAGGDGGATGGAGYGRSGDTGGGGGGSIGGGAGTQAGTSGGTGANAVDVSGLFTACASALAPVSPYITSFTPTSGLSGTSITITGSGFTGTSAVKIGGIALSSFSVNSNTEITGTVSALTVSGSVTVVASKQSVSKPIYLFTAPVAPAINNFSPTSAQLGTVITINGNKFLGTTQVSFGGTNASSFTVVSEYQILASVAAGTSGSVSVTSSSGTGTLAGFTYVATTQASAITGSSISQNSITIGWTNGNASKRVVFVKEGAGAITNPGNNTTYTASANWASKGSQLGSSGYYCVYNGTGTSVNVTGLTAGTSYTIQVFEYNGVAGAEVYYLATATNNPNTQTTLGLLPLVWGPVELNIRNEKVAISWSTVMEENIQSFSVNYSNDGQQWQIISTIPSKGNNVMGNSYSHLHSNPKSGWAYYRIGMKDADGKNSYTGIQKVQINKTSSAFVMNTIVEDRLFLNLRQSQQIRIYNNAGQLMITKELSPGTSCLDLRHLKAGVYWVKTNNEKTSILKR